VKQRQPESVGEVLRDLIERQLGITQDALAEAMRVSRYSINQLVNGRRAVTAEMALRLSRALGTTPQFWLNLQRSADIFDAQVRLARELSQIKALRRAPLDDELFYDVD
jgi:addiction module HigA family antidote